MCIIGVNKCNVIVSVQHSPKIRTRQCFCVQADEFSVKTPRKASRGSLQNHVSRPKSLQHTQCVHGAWRSYFATFSVSLLHKICFSKVGFVTALSEKKGLQFPMFRPQNRSFIERFLQQLFGCQARRRLSTHFPGI